MPKGPGEPLQLRLEQEDWPQSLHWLHVEQHVTPEGVVPCTRQVPSGWQVNSPFGLGFQLLIHW